MKCTNALPLTKIKVRRFYFLYMRTMQAIQNLPIDVFFSHKPLYALKRAGIFYVKDLPNVKLERILSLRNVGEKTYEMVNDFIKNMENDSIKIQYPVKNKRDETILILRFKNRKTLQEIGKKYELTRERVRQICDRYYFIFKHLFSFVKCDSKQEDMKEIYNKHIENNEIYDISLREFEVIFYVLCNYQQLSRKGVRAYESKNNKNTDKKF